MKRWVKISADVIRELCHSIFGFPFPRGKRPPPSPPLQDDGHGDDFFGLLGILFLGGLIFGMIYLISLAWHLGAR